MQAFCWDDNFLTGIKDVDVQHQHLVDIINQFGNLLLENKVSLADIDKLFTELADYTVYHFKDEEEYMLRTGIYKQHYDTHIIIHKQFVNKVIAMHSDISEDDILEKRLQSAKELLNYLTHWLAYHILGTDQNMARQAEAIQSGMSAKDAYKSEEKSKDKANQLLINAMTALFEQVSEKNKALVDLNQSLEERVKLRTKELSDANVHLEELSLTDVLTNLPNRRHAMRFLASLWKESIETKTPLVCMMLDADYFKAVNDTYGHDAGDFVLKELANTLKNTLRNDDIVCRLGGDEFFVICPNTNKEGGLYTAELIHKAVNKLAVPTGQGSWHGSISIGVACKTVDMKNFEELIKVADNGVYAAKNAGKNCVRLG